VKFSIDPWDPGYGGSVDADLGVSTAEVVTDVEVPNDRWAPVAAQPGLQPPATVLFVDGVRRVDAQVWVDEGVGTVAPGLCASYAAGIVCCCERDGAHLAAFEVRRSLVTAARDAEKIVTWAGTYDIVAHCGAKQVTGRVKISSRRSLPFPLPNALNPQAARFTARGQEITRVFSR